MTQDEIRKRKELVSALETAAEIAKSIKTEGWEIPALHIAGECQRFADAYRRSVQYAEKKGGQP